MNRANRLLLSMLGCLFWAWCVPSAVAADPETHSTADALLKTLDPFYTQHVVVDTLPIVSSKKVSPYALREAAYLVRKMLEKRPDILEKLAEKKMYVVVMAYNEMTTEIPENRRMSPWWDKRARGLGGRPVSCGEENLLCYQGDAYKGENIFIHEFAHGIHGALAAMNPKFNTRLRALHQEAKATGRFRGYGMGSFGEFWAEAVQSWFDCNRRGGLERLDAHGRHVCHIDSRVQLKEQMPAIAKLIGDTFQHIPWVYVSVPKRTRLEHLEGYDASKSPTFTWPPRVIETFNRIEAEKAKKRAEKKRPKPATSFHP